MNRGIKFALVAALTLMGGRHCMAQEGNTAVAQETVDARSQMDNAAAQVPSNLVAKNLAPENLVADPAFIHSVAPVKFVPEQHQPNKRLWLGLTIMGQLAAAGDVTTIAVCGRGLCLCCFGRSGVAKKRTPSTHTKDLSVGAGTTKRS